MGRIIINYDETISPWVVVNEISRVIAKGKISEACGVSHYCWVSAFSNHRIFTLQKRLKRDGTRTETDSFEVINIKKENNDG